MSEADWDDYTISRFTDPAFDEWDDYGDGAEEIGGGIADREEDWDYSSDGDMAAPCETYTQPTVWQILRRQGIRAAINYKCERLCVGAFADMHRDAEQHGYTLARPGYKMPWWFKWASKLEWYTRPKRK